MELIVALVLAGFAVFVLVKGFVIVPEQQAHVIEQFGKYKRTLDSGLHFVTPLVQQISYRHSLKEEVIDVPPQLCITKDNVQVEVDGILYLMVVDPLKTSYGIDNYKFATAQLAQTTMRSEMGKIELDKSFSERDILNASIVKAVDEASDPWGIKVTRYEIKDITPSRTVQEAMERQVRAEREKRAEILKSEGDKLSRINLSKGEKEEAINISKAERQKRVNVSEGRAKAIELISQATATGIQEIADAINQPGGKAAVSMRIAEQFIQEFGNIIGSANTQVLPKDLANFKGFLKSVLSTTGEENIVSSLANKMNEKA